jgi:hypothetical protein
MNEKSAKVVLSTDPIFTESIGTGPIYKTLSESFSLLEYVQGSVLLKDVIILLKTFYDV